MSRSRRCRRRRGCRWQYWDRGIRPTHCSEVVSIEQCCVDIPIGPVDIAAVVQVQWGMYPGRLRRAYQDQMEKGGGWPGREMWRDSPERYEIVQDNHGIQKVDTSAVQQLLS